MTDKHFCLDDSPWFRMVELGEVTSTNDFLKAYRPLEERRITLVTAEHQTAGRGAGQNRWESQPGQNLLFSLLVHPRHIPAHRMFVLSEVLALAITAPLKAPLNPPIMGDFVRGGGLPSPVIGDFVRSGGRSAFKTASPDRYELLKAFVKENRQHPTEAEKALWEMIKDNNLGYRFRRQHIIGDYIVDFACLQKNLVVEIDGGYHAELEQKEYDANRTASLQRMGFKVIRFTNEEVIADTKRVLSDIKAAITKAPLAAPLNPPIMGDFVRRGEKPSPIMGGAGGGLLIKWPNDIYYGDRKLCGMLIENELRGQTVECSILGVGININQTEFKSPIMGGFRGAPISLAQILGCEVERRFVLEAIMEHFTRYYEWTEQGRFDELHEMYLANLYRRDELHRFCDAGGEFLGTIVDVEPTGHLIIVDEAGDRRRYAFKEVEYIIKEK